MLKRINSNKENQRIHRSQSTNSKPAYSPFKKDYSKNSKQSHAVLRTCENTMPSGRQSKAEQNSQQSTKIANLERENSLLKSLLLSTEEGFNDSLKAKDREIKKLNKIILDLVKKQESTQQKLLKDFTPRNERSISQRKASNHSSIPKKDISFLAKQIEILDSKLREAEKLSKDSIFISKGNFQNSRKNCEENDISIHKSNLTGGGGPIPSVMKVLSIAQIAKASEERNN